MLQRIKVLVADDHALFRRGLCTVLAEDSSVVVVAEAQNGMEACLKAMETKPDVILMDINMPEMNGMLAAREILTQLPHVKIVMLTFQKDEEYLFEAIKSGARGYLLKDMEPLELSVYIKDVMRGEAPISKTMASKMLLEFASMAKVTSVEPNRDIKELSIREKDVLRMVAQGASNKEIALSLHISEYTVKNHLRNILDKLQLENRVQAAAYAMREGIV